MTRISTKRYAVPLLILIGIYLCGLGYLVYRDPTKVIAKQINQFRTEYSKKFITYQTENRTMNAAWSGDENKTPLLFVHGSPGSWEAWAEFLLNPDLQKQFHLLAVDRPGYGGSNKGHTETSLQKQAADVFKVLQFNKSAQKPILIGHSFGGPVIARIAVDHPNEIAGLIFVASALDPSLEDKKWFQAIAEIPLFRWLIPSKLRVCNEEIIALKQELENMVPLWQNIHVPVVIIHGDQDALVPIKNVAFMKEHLKNAPFLKVDEIHGLNHFVPWLRPDLILNAIHQF